MPTQTAGRDSSPASNRFERSRPPRQDRPPSASSAPSSPSVRQSPQGQRRGDCHPTLPSSSTRRTDNPSSKRPALQTHIRPVDDSQTLTHRPDHGGKKRETTKRPPTGNRQWRTNR
jgi:hypothetical protein